MSCEDKKNRMDEAQARRDAAFDRGSDAWHNLDGKQTGRDKAWGDFTACLGDSDIALITEMRRLACGNESGDYEDATEDADTAETNYDRAEAEFEAAEREFDQAEKEYCDCKRGQ